MTESTHRPREWDATTYDRISDPHVRWGAMVLDRLILSGDECVLDAGCGSGRVTEQLLARLPRGRVIGLDASSSMLEEAARRLEAQRDRVEFVRADLNQPLPLEQPVHAVFSTATFHWLPDHNRLFRHLAAAIKPGGQLVAQCGGTGCIDTIVEALQQVGDGWDGPWNFATAEDTKRRLEESGFVDVHTWLHDEPTPLEPGEPLLTFLGTVILGAHLDRLPKEKHESFVRAVAAHLPHPERPVIDYVRLNIVARRG